MAIAARGAAMMDTTSALIGNARVRTVVFLEPITRAMALRAVQAKPAGVEGRIGMAARTCRGQSSELARGMAFLTSHSRVNAGQREFAAAVIESSILPIGGGMAGRAIRAELPVVLIVLFMAGI